jgi:bacterioferritin-associated ferredoxin
MYVCVCNAVSDSAIRKAVENGVSETGCGTQCGSCVPHARAVMDTCLAENGKPVSNVKLQVVSCG